MLVHNIEYQVYSQEEELERLVERNAMLKKRADALERRLAAAKEVYLEHVRSGKYKCSRKDQGDN